MKYFIVILLFAACAHPTKKNEPVVDFQAAQDSTIPWEQLKEADADTTAPTFRISSSRTAWGYRESGVSLMLWLDDSTFQMEGDSLSVIKMLWKRIDDCHKNYTPMLQFYNSQIERYDSVVKAYQELVNKMHLQQTTL